ncbi:hypothetical protein DKX38_003354 [Salix brachista]|uniref:Aldehyde dehydrogenase domain-containing protein n=1 Tax=Salix brachista TaxID=2182728 RepID=A0A5N5NSC8_9ROSI|nr:hypothetical protein DKX38_003354 [Salix brachista]
MAAKKISTLLSRSFSSAAPCFFSRGRSVAGQSRLICRYNSTLVAVEEPITPPVSVKHTQLLINGQFVDAASGKTFPTLDPRTGEVIAHVAEGDVEDVNRAVSAARKAFDEGPWPRMTAYERSRIILRFADLLEQHTDEIAALETWDNGKPYEQAANTEIPMTVRLFRYYAGWADKIHGLTVPADGPYHVQTLHEPIGVAGQIIPWNFPMLMFSWKVGPALACGNTVVIKTAEQTPLSAVYAAKLFHEAGLPDGVLNVVSGFGPTAGAALASHMEVDKNLNLKGFWFPKKLLNSSCGNSCDSDITAQGCLQGSLRAVVPLAFTGSTDTGKIVLELASKSNLKPVTLELGGKSAFIVCEDADVDQAVELSHSAVFFNQGQCCCAGSRTFVHEHVYNEFVEKARARAMNRSVGDPFKVGIEQGPQVDSDQFEKILRCIRSGVESGAILETGGDRFGSNGYYIQPTVFSNVQDDMSIAKEEIFGPVQSILKFKDLDEVIKRANNSRYGLAAGIFTHNLDTANTLSRALKVGTVWINCYDVFDAAVPFGGYKMSGNGREKGIYSLNNYLQVKAVVTALKNPSWL